MINKIDGITENLWTRVWWAPVWGTGTWVFIVKRSHAYQMFFETNKDLGLLLMNASITSEW